ncbi:MAG: aldehyde dehydrogenase [Candidatus Eisenbacteria bacterium]|uniref:Aldehyde dehydrogenase n=1 Tax=Eiseniibacteriota bacterium TaxID=2212470 RepID=A0A938BRD2_UNCEI|nr:aldehyde dehydrogenase [Candidatus Eisenbacteria bacterium]
MSVRVGLMGFGRIGRNIFRISRGLPEIEIAVISDVADPQALEYLLRFDTVHGRFGEPFKVADGFMYIGGKQIRMLAGREPGDVPWAQLGVQIVVEATGQYRTREWLQKHLDAGAQKVILTTPPRDRIEMVVVSGVNDDQLKPEHRMLSIGSCTSNAVAPIVKVLHEGFGIRQAFMTTIHAYTNDQRLADVPHSELRRSRAAAENIIPASTWSPMAVERIVPAMKGRIAGLAMNVPVQDGSVVDLVTLMEREVTRDEVNHLVWSAAQGRLRNITEFTDQPIVSSDVVGNSHSAIFDSLATMVIGGNLAKTLIWYDNGWGYAARAVELIQKLAAWW